MDLQQAVKDLESAGVKFPFPETMTKEDTSAYLSILEKKLYKYPPESPGHNYVRFIIQELFHKEGGKYDKLVIVFPSAINRQAKKDPMLDFASKWVGVRDVEFSVHMDYMSGSLFSTTRTFVEDRNFTAIPRRQAEYDLQWKQLVVCSYITDGNNILLLHTKKGGQTRIEDRFTMIQGHVEYSEKALLMSQYEFLAENARMEFEEEIKTTISIKFPELPKYFINTRTNPIDLEHFGIVYEIRVDDLKKIAHDIHTGEESKHDVVVLPLNIEAYEQNREKLDVWADSIIRELLRK